MQNLMLSRIKDLDSSDEEALEFSQEKNKKTSNLEDLKSLNKFLEPVSVTIEKSPAKLLLLGFKHFVKHRLSFTGMIDKIKLMNRICEEKVV